MLALNCSAKMLLPIPMDNLTQKGTIESKAERARCPPLARMLMSGEMSGAGAKELTAKQKFDRWFVYCSFLLSLKISDSSLG